MELPKLGSHRGFGIGSGIAVVIGLISLVIVDNVQKAQSWNSTLTSTIIQYVVPIGSLGLLVMAAGDYMPR